MATKRVGLKDIAEAAGISVGNVSMVLSGRGDEARISKASQQRIFDCAKQLNYKPNANARRLRMQSSDKMLIALFFCPSPQVAIAGSFMTAIHDILSELPSDMAQPDIVLYPYQRGHLKKADKQIHQAFFDAAIFGGMAKEDMDYLESIKTTVPIVLLNRISKVHHYVYINNMSIGEVAARLIREKGFSNVYLVSSRTPSTAGSERRDGFIHSCERLAIPLLENHILRVSDGYRGGEEAVARIPFDHDRPDFVFFSDSQMAISAMHGFDKLNIAIPDELSVLTYNGGTSEGYTIPSLSSIHMPMDDMSRDCLHVAMKAALHPECGQLSVQHKPLLILRDSTK